MKTLQVKRYHKEIAKQKELKALERRKNKDSFASYPVKSMFYFMLEDNRGYPTTLRKRGYVAFSDNKACFGFTPEKAIKEFKKW